MPNLVRNKIDLQSPLVVILECKASELLETPERDNQQQSYFSRVIKARLKSGFYLFYKNA